MRAAAAQRIQFPRLKSIDKLMPSSRHLLDGLTRSFSAVNSLDDARLIVTGVQIGSQGVTLQLQRAPAPGFCGGHHELVIQEGNRKVRIVRATWQGVTLEWRAPEYNADPNSELDARAGAGRN